MENRCRRLPTGAGNREDWSSVRRGHATVVDTDLLCDRKSKPAQNRP